MAIRLPYETKAGEFSEAESFLQLMEHLKLAAEGLFAIGHFRKENGDLATGECFLVMGRSLEALAHTVTRTATRHSGSH